MTAHYQDLPFFSTSIWTPSQNASFHNKVNVWVKDLHSSQLTQKKKVWMPQVDAFCCDFQNILCWTEQEET